VKAELLDLTELPGLFNEAREGFDITRSTGVSFRACVQGEIIGSVECEVCGEIIGSAESYSLESVVKLKTECRECSSTEGVLRCRGNEVRQTDRQTDNNRRR
jgi:hypothetical protein